MTKWEWIGFVAVIVIMVAYVVALVFGPKLRNLVSRCPEFVDALIFAVGGGLIAIVITSVTDIEHFSRKALGQALFKERWSGIVGLVLLVIAGMIVYSRRQRIQVLKDDHEADLDRHRVEWTQFIGTDLLRTLVAYGEALLQPDQALKNEWVRSAQRVTIWMASKYIGKAANNGTRSCLYRLNEAEQKLVPVHGVYWGREPCTKHFDADHPTYKAIIRKKPVVRAAIPEAEVEAENLSYRSYIAQPVSVQKDTIYGALMVDCPGANDLDEVVDGAKAALLASLLAATFYVLKNRPAGNTTK